MVSKPQRDNSPREVDYERKGPNGKWVRLRLTRFGTVAFVIVVIVALLSLGERAAAAGRWVATFF